MEKQEQNRVYYLKNRDQIRAQQNVYRQANRDRLNRSRKLKKYDLTPEIYTTMLESQDGRCKICGTVLVNPQVDHNHVTNEVRALLCLHCNTMIGLAKEDVRILKSAISYLEAHGGTR